jgi:hypothetical protein
MPTVTDGQPSAGQNSAGRRVSPEAGLYDKFILPGQRAPKLTGKNKVAMGFRDAVTPVSALGWFAAGTYAEITDGPPNYQAGGKAYIERIGAAAARGVSQEVFSTALFSTLLHEDPRYYKRGKSHKATYRVLYAASRTFVTRTDGGRPTLNLARLLGNLGGTSLTQAYYPSQNRGFDDLARTYGESLAGTSLSLVFDEFLSDALAVMHLQKLQFVQQ